VDFEQVSIAKIFAELLQALGEDPNREGLKDTPFRAANFWKTLNVKKPPPDRITCFVEEKCDQMVVQSNISFYTLCEHHILPFFGAVHIGYLPKNKVIGLSKFSRIVDHFASRLQIQERFTNQIADFIVEKADPQGVGVVVDARHLCMEMRGIRRNTITDTTALRGVFLEEESIKNEFFGKIRRREI